MKNIFWVLITILFITSGCALAYTSPPGMSPTPYQPAPIGQPAPSITLAPSAQALKETNQLFNNADYKHFHKNKKIELFPLKNPQVSQDSE